MIFPVCLLFSLHMLLTTLAVGIVSVRLALYLHSVPMYGLCLKWKPLSFLYVLLLKCLLVGCVNSLISSYTWSCVRLHIVEGFLADEIIWVNLVNYRHQDGTPLNTTALELLGSTFFTLWKFHRLQHRQWVLALFPWSFQHSMEMTPCSFSLSSTT